MCHKTSASYLAIAMLVILNSGPAPAGELSLSTEAAKPGLLQSALTTNGWDAGLLDQWGLQLRGHVEGGVVYNIHNTPGGVMGNGRLFDTKNQDPTLDQIGLTLSRPINISATESDLGFKLDAIYGSDVRYTQANGTNFYGSGTANRQLPLPSSPNILVIVPGQQYPENQIDILQAYVTYNLPVAQGVLLTAGKFVTPWGHEHINPTQNEFYSHSYIFGVSQPMTLTGITADIPLNDQFAVKGGVVVGWDQSLEDNNDIPSALAQVSYRAPDGWNLVVSALVGQEQPDDRSKTRWLVDATLDFPLSPEISCGLEAVFGFEPGVSTSIAPNGARVWVGNDAIWCGAAGYGSYKLDSEGKCAFQIRGEYFNDSAGARQIISEIYAGTVGLRIVPCPDTIGQHVIIRPEVRWDWATDRIFDGGRRQSQITIGADVIFEF